MSLVWGKTANHFPAKSVPLYIASAMIYHHNINYKAKFIKATFRAQWSNNVSRCVRGLGNRWWLFYDKHLLCEKLTQFSQRCCKCQNLREYYSVWRDGTTAMQFHRPVTRQNSSDVINGLATIIFIIFLWRMEVGT